MLLIVFLLQISAATGVEKDAIASSDITKAPIVSYQIKHSAMLLWTWAIDDITFTDGLSFIINLKSGSKLKR